MRIKELTEKRNGLVCRMNEILENLRTENRSINDEEQAEFDSAEAEIRSIDSTISAIQRAEKITKNVQPTAKETENRAETDEKIFRDFISGRIQEMRAGEQNVTMSNNGAVIPSTISKKIIDEVTDICPILARADRYSEKGELKIPKWVKANNHDVSFGFASEFTDLVADSGKFESANLGGYLAGGLVLIGKSVINNSGINVTGFITRKIADKAASFVENQLLNGTGSNAPQGALNTGNTITTKSATAITFDELVQLQSSIKQVYQKNACWTMNPQTFTAVKLLTDNNGHSLIQPDGTKEFPFTLLGKPVYISDNMPTVAAGAKSVLYGDYSGLSVNFHEDISIEVLREQFATKHAIGLVSWMEFDAKVTDENKLAVLVQKAS